MPNLLVDLIDILAREGLVQGDGIDCYRDLLPDKPDVAYSFVEYSGTPSSSVSLSVKNVQISVRSTSYADSRSKIYAIFNYLHKPADMIFEDDVTGRWFIGGAKQTPFKLKVDTTDRTIFAFNYSITTYND